MFNQTPRTSEDYFERGNSSHDDGNLNGAIVDYTKAIQVNDDIAFVWRAYGNRGLAYEQIGNVDAAVQDYQRVVKECSLVEALINAHSNLSGIYLDRQEYQKALYHIDSAIVSSGYSKTYGQKRTSSLYYNRGLSYLRIGNLDYAILDFDKAISLNPHDIDNYLERGEAYLCKREFFKVVEDCIKAERMGGRSRQLYLLRAKAYLELEDVARTIDDIEKLLQLGG